MVCSTISLVVGLRYSFDFTNKCCFNTILQASIGDWCFVDEGFPSAYFGDFISEMSHLVPDKDSDSAGVGNGIQDIQPCVPVDSQAFQLPPTAATRELNSQERDSALSRYKEKKKTRR